MRRGQCLSANFFKTIFWSLLSVVATGSVPAWADSVHWDRLADGLLITLWSPPSTCPHVPSLIALDIDPARYRFAVHYYRTESLDEPLDIHEWQTRTGYDLVFNAGLFRENFAYLGLLYGNGRSLGGKQHGTWLGVFAAEPTLAGMAPARILDLAVDSFDEQRIPYREAAQSLMLLDQAGRIRVRQTGKQAQQTIVGELHNGHILLLKTTQPAALYDIGRCLRETFPAIRRAMAMDGGSSSDMALAPALHPHTPERAWAPFLEDLAAGHIGLPAVIGISPRK
jgi:uncharacterized protein YigE (DUF2233 family)